MRDSLQSRSRFWEKDGCNGFGSSEFPQEIFHPTFDQPGTRGLLASYMLTGVGQRAAPWILNLGSHLPPRKWKESTTACSITWRDPSQKSGLRTPGRAALVPNI